MATVQELETQLDVVDGKLNELRRQVAALKRPERAPADGTVVQWLEAIRQENASRAGSREQLFRQMGVDTSRPQIPPEEIQQRMLAEGVRPEERVVSSEIRRMREE